MRTWIIVDGNNLSHRAFHAMGDLSHEGVATGVLFGVLKDVVTLSRYYQSNDFIFCFDCGVPLRAGQLPTYKETRINKRRVMTDEERAGYGALQRQIRRLRNGLLEELGYPNVWFHNGYEADDMIAVAARDIPKTDEGVIVSSDGDMYQLLSDNVYIFQPRKRKTVTKETFKEEWGLTPAQWAEVKAIAGCDGDDVPGVKGVAEKTAAKFVLGTLKASTQALRNIVAQRPQWTKNIPLVKLPYEGCPSFELLPPQTTKAKWQRVVSELGMDTLERQYPLCTQ